MLLIQFHLDLGLERLGVLLPLLVAGDEDCDEVDEGELYRKKYII